MDTTNRPAHDWLTVAEAADAARVCRHTVYEWLREGLPHVRRNARFVRIARADLDAWLNEDRVVRHRAGAGPPAVVRMPQPKPGAGDALLTVSGSRPRAEGVGTARNAEARR